MQFSCNAARQKLRSTLFDSPANITDTTDYVSNFIYKNGQLSYILMPEGRILVNGNTFDYEYHLKDHLGNTRATYIAGANGTSTINQTTAYYPFGLPINALSSNLENNPYLYNGKELHFELNMDLLDYGARYYDAEVGRWWSVDILSELHFNTTPYHYVFNSPIINIDPLGLDSVDANGVHHLDEVTVKAERITNRSIFSFNPIAMAYRLDPGAANRGTKLSWGKSLNYEQQQRHEQWMGGIYALTKPLWVMALPVISIFGTFGTINLNTTSTYLIKTAINLGISAGEEFVGQYMSLGNAKAAAQNMDMFDIAVGIIPVKKYWGVFEGAKAISQSFIDINYNKGFNRNKISPILFNNLASKTVMNYTGGFLRIRTTSYRDGLSRSLIAAPINSVGNAVNNNMNNYGF